MEKGVPGLGQPLPCLVGTPGILTEQAHSRQPGLGPPAPWCPAGGPLASPQDIKMEVPMGTQCRCSKRLLLSGKEEVYPRA